MVSLCAPAGFLGVATIKFSANHNTEFEGKLPMAVMVAGLETRFDNFTTRSRPRGNIRMLAQLGMSLSALRKARRSNTLELRAETDHFLG